MSHSMSRSSPVALRSKRDLFVQSPAFTRSKDATRGSWHMPGASGIATRSKKLLGAKTLRKPGKAGGNVRKERRRTTERTHPTDGKDVRKFGGIHAEEGSMLLRVLASP